MNRRIQPPFIPETLLTLGNSLIRHNETLNEYIHSPVLYRRYTELYTYPWIDVSIDLLEDLLENELTLSQFYKQQYKAYFDIMRFAEPRLLFLLMKYRFLYAKILEEYPIIHYDATEELPVPLELHPVYRAVRLGEAEDRTSVFEPHEHRAYLGSLQEADFELKRLRKVLLGLDSLVFNTDLVIAIPCLKIACLQTVFEFSREPYITRDEIADVVRNFRGWDIPEDTVEHIVNRFESKFSKSRQPRQPRSLQHLCVVQIREALYNADGFPHGIPLLRVQKLDKDKLVWLNIPREIQQLILGKKPDYSIHDSAVLSFRSGINRPFALMRDI